MRTLYAMLILNLIVPFVMILVGTFLKRHPVKDMKSHNGYDTPNSRKSQEHWDFAQSIAPDIFIGIGKVTGIAELVLSLFLFVCKIPVDIALYVGLGIGICFLILGFMVTEKRIKDRFAG